MATCVLYLAKRKLRPSGTQGDQASLCIACVKVGTIVSLKLKCADYGDCDAGAGACIAKYTIQLSSVGGGKLHKLTIHTHTQTRAHSHNFIAIRRAGCARIFICARASAPGLKIC